MTLRSRFARLCGLALLGGTLMHPAAAQEPEEAQKAYSRQVYQSYINQTLIGRFGTDKFYQVWLYGDGTFASYDQTAPQPDLHAPSGRPWTGSSWWAEGKSNDWRLCLKPPGGQTACHQIAPDHRPGDHWFDADGDMVLMKGLVWTYPHQVKPSPNNPSANDPATRPDAIPDEAQKAASRKIYAGYVNNTLVCGFNGEGGCMLWLFEDGSFLVHNPPGPSGEAITEPLSQRIGKSWWATGTDADRKLCLLHVFQDHKFLVCYHLQPDHKPGDVWFEADDTMALLNGRN